MSKKLKIHDGNTPGEVFEVKLEYPKPKVATMNDIWHKADITPESCRILICKTNKGQNYTAIIPSQQEWNTMILPEFYNLGDIDNAERIEQYAYLDDLLALEHELDRTRKALDVAVDALKEIGFGGVREISNENIRTTNIATNAIEQINEIKGGK